MMDMLGVPALANDLAVLNDHRTHNGVRVHAADTAACELDRTIKQGEIIARERHWA